MASPYKMDKDYWNDLPDSERHWIRRFMKAFEYGDFDELRALCDEAPSEEFERLKSEIMYERDFYKRDQAPTMTRSRYSEADYGWAQPVENSNKRNAIDVCYYNDQTTTDYEDRIVRKARRK